MSQRDKRQLESVNIRFKQANRRRKRQLPKEKLTIGSFNIQKTKALSIVAQLATQHDIFFIQEFPASTTNIATLSDYSTRAGLEFYSSPTRCNTINQTGIFIKTTQVKVLGTHELHLPQIFRKYYTSIRVRLPDGEHVLLINFYLPSADKRLQAQILWEAIFSIESLKESFPNLKVLYGGDLNHSMEATPTAEREVVVAIRDLNHNIGTEDLAKYDRGVAIYPTNSALTCRRIDRIYAPVGWRQRAICYEISKPPIIISSHHMISVSYGFEQSREVFIGKSPFQYPLGRLDLPLVNTRRRRIDPGLPLEDAILALHSDGLEYIKLMGSMRKYDPAIAKWFLDESPTKEAEEIREAATKTFFQASKKEKTIFTVLRNGINQTSAHETSDIIALATDYYKDLFKVETPAEESDINTFLYPMGSRINESERNALDVPFTMDELLKALKTADMATAPGPDGIQFPVLLHYWEDIGPIMTRTANEIMRTGKLPDCLKRVWITLTPKPEAEESQDIKDLRPLSLSNTTLKVISKAACIRLQRVTNKLVGPYQRGFIKDRRINQNTMEFFTLIDLVCEQRDETYDSKYQAVLMADFTKAFDRISHEYMQAVLKKAWNRRCHDYAIAASVIENFEKISNSKVNPRKSQLLGFHPDFADHFQHELPYTQTYVRDKDLKYLGLPLKGVDWSAVRAKLPFISFKRGYSQLDVITKAKATNMYVSSTLVYKDLVQCMSKKEIKAMDDAIQRVFYGIGREKLYARPKKGGYGVIELAVQLQGHRAAVLANTLMGTTDWYTGYLKLKMLHHMSKIIHRLAEVPVHRIEGLSWLEFLLDTERTYFKNLDWTFTHSERMYLEAWQKAVTGTRAVTRPERVGFMETGAIQEQVKQAISIGETQGKFQITNEEAGGLRADAFRSLSKKSKEKAPVVRPRRFLEICREARKPQRWKKFWKEMYKHEWLLRNDLTALHHFNYGSYVPIHDAPKVGRDMECLLCLETVSSKAMLAHLYNECTCSRYWWNKIGFPRPMNLREMLAPTDKSFTNLRNLNWFVKVVRKAYSGRRREAENGVSLAPLLNRLLSRALGRTNPMGR
ncbi:hypothetical protein HF325_006807 [Metschnikowia pulcherrima]|uniref:Reverse transcriptase domain-containing protein n=1 Tax=Metschnikowia pulcherrima TaxID=27326 RepID=A0A8H7GKM3_9ASCO|nr:hypothetical protein HF325_006807 [Metschnikowia pulcherrima]